MNDSGAQLPCYSCPTYREQRWNDVARAVCTLPRDAACALGNSCWLSPHPVRHNPQPTISEVFQARSPRGIPALVAMNCSIATIEAALGGSKPAAPPASSSASTSRTLTGDGQQQQDDLPQPVPGNNPALRHFGRLWQQPCLLLLMCLCAELLTT